jgi:hypothetical protein
MYSPKYIAEVTALPMDRNVHGVQTRVIRHALSVSGKLPSVCQAIECCSALSDKYTTYAQDNGVKTHNSPPAAVASAMSKCSSAPGSSIAVLENALNSAKMSLPPRI